eukprot:CAMPEP_0202756446 /NCGR_PEP_ID=MMETSP1388-20130828/15708_1 /ASSEMBLY_ACC=CAM_ASM_000864 /TAXON_ID=37098 /ORGANISM="Isochrysis sp, Strain CCMP1244" /LENGTH=166 /DNA_ID=CAMNT_0049424297 /DNA_START=254 /DNA_END=754 /DNA_ORIENTATION=+
MAPPYLPLCQPDDTGAARSSLVGDTAPRASPARYLLARGSRAMPDPPQAATSPERVGGRRGGGGGTGRESRCEEVRVRHAAASWLLLAASPARLRPSAPGASGKQQRCMLDLRGERCGAGGGAQAASSSNTNPPRQTFSCSICARDFKTAKSLCTHFKTHNYTPAA